MLARISGCLLLMFGFASAVLAQMAPSVTASAGPGLYQIQLSWSGGMSPYSATCYTNPDYPTTQSGIMGYSISLFPSTVGGAYTCKVIDAYGYTGLVTVVLPYDPDPISPTLLSGPSVVPYETHADISFAYNVAVKVYQLVIPTGGVPPTQSQIEDPATYTAGPAYYPASYYPASASTVSTIPTIGTLTPSSAYTLYLVAKKYTGSGYLISSANFTTTGSVTPFVFDPVSNAALGTAVTSNPAVWHNSSAGISISGGEYSVNGGAFTAASGTLKYGDSVRIKVVAPTGCVGSSMATVTAGANSANFVVTSVDWPSCVACQSVVDDADLFAFCQASLAAGDTCSVESPQRTGLVSGQQTEKRIFCRSSTGGSASGRATWTDYSDQVDVLTNGSVVTSSTWAPADGGASYVMESFKMNGCLSMLIAGATYDVTYDQLFGTLSAPVVYPSHTVGSAAFDGGAVTINGNPYADIGVDWAFWPPLPRAFVASLSVNLGNTGGTVGAGSSPSSSAGVDIQPSPPPTGPIDVPSVDTGGTDIQPVTDTSQIFVQPGAGVIVNNYIAEIVTGQTVVVSPTATTGAVVRIITAAPVIVESGGSRVIVQATGTSQPVFQVAIIGGTPTLVPVAGSFSMTSESGGATLPLAGGSEGSAVLQAQGSGTRIDASIGVGAGTPLVAAVSSGQVQFQRTTRTRATPATVTLYAGEALSVDRTAGTLDTLRFGSLDQNSGRPGDYIANIPLSDGALSVPIISGAVQRFSDALNLVVGRAIARQVGLDPARVTGLSQDAFSGIITLTTTTGSYRYLPVGSIQIDLDKLLRAISAADIAANLEQVVAEGLRFAVAPATSTQDLQTALRQIDPEATVRIAADGIARVKVNNYDYAVQPAPLLTRGAPGAASLTEANGSLTLRDAAGNIQTLYAAFAELDNVKSTFKASDANFAIANNRDGTYRATYGGTAYTLKPVLRVVWPFPARTDAWWEDAGKLFVRYPSGQAQEFSLQ